MSERCIHDNSTEQPCEYCEIDILLDKLSALSAEHARDQERLSVAVETMQMWIDDLEVIGDGQVYGDPYSTVNLVVGSIRSQIAKLKEPRHE